MQTKVSVIIPTRNNALVLNKTLYSLYPCKDDIFELIIVNNASSDNTDKIIKKHSTSLPIITLTSSIQSRSIARNTGATQAQGDILLFLDDDILVDKNLVSYHLKIQHKYPGIVRGQLIDLLNFALLEDRTDLLHMLDDSKLKVGIIDLDKFRKFTNPLERIVKIVFAEGYQNKFSWLAGSMGNLSMHRSVWQLENGFNELFGKNWGCEDLELAYRLFKKNVAINYNISATGYHLPNRIGSYRMNEHNKNLSLFYKLHPFPEIKKLVKLLGPKGDVNFYLSNVIKHETYI